MDGHSAQKATVIAQPTEFASSLPATFAPQSNSVMNLIGSPCSATMDSPLFYELDAFSENNNISADKLKDSHRSTYHQLTSFSQNLQTQQPQQQHLQQAQQSAQHLNNASAVQTPVSSSARGLAPVRISSAVFGNARPADLSEVSNYSDLADINTPEISLDIQVNISEGNRLIIGCTFVWRIVSGINYICELADAFHRVIFRISRAICSRSYLAWT
jgi:hypothetical protein